MDFEDFVRKAQSVCDSGKEEACADGQACREKMMTNGGVRETRSGIENGSDRATSKTVESDDETSAESREWFYLRSLGTDPRKDVSDISVGFPELAPDFVAPPFVPDGAFFSSVFRIASPGMQVVKLTLNL